MYQEHFTVTGMTCSACSARVEQCVKKLPGVQEVSVNLLKNSMVVSYHKEQLHTSAIIQAVEKAGYGAISKTEDTKNISPKKNVEDLAKISYKNMKKRLFLSILFTVPLFYISMGHMMNWPLPYRLLGMENSISFAFTQFLLLIPILLINQKYFQTGFTALCHGRPNMDSLIAIGSGAATLYGIYAIYKIGVGLGTGNHHLVHSFTMDLYFESAGMILTLITLGKTLEARAKGKTSEAITKLMNLAPKTATVQREGQEIILPTEEVLCGDILLIKAGESIPVDGIVLEGFSSVDESALTGESIPIEKHIGDSVTGATINKSGYLKIQATKVGDDTTLAQIIRLVDEATSTKAPIAKLADKVSGVFVPIVMGIALLSGIFWLMAGYGLEFSLSMSISVLVISCPCALGLATPTAIMVGTGKGASMGILFKSAESLETAHNIDTVVFDKTGTITFGTPMVTDILPHKGYSKEKLLQMAASLEKLSEHPLAEAIVTEAEKNMLSFLPVKNFTQIPGQGITGMIQQQLYLAGNSRLLKSYGLWNETLFTLEETLAAQGKTPLFFACENTVIGIIGVSDLVKPTSSQAVSELSHMGVQVIMLTGDHKKTAEAVGQQVGVHQVVAEVLPQDKEKIITNLQNQGKVVAMVGDGINDAPALAKSQVGIAIGAGTDIAIESADVVLMKSDLLDVSTAIQLSKAVIGNIKQNLFWAFIYNIIGIPVAAGVFFLPFSWKLNPMIGAFAMSFSSVFVVTNALRLRWFQSKHYTKQKDQKEKKENCNTEELPIQNHQKGEFHMEKNLIIEGMMCQHCVMHVRKALESLSGVLEVSVQLEQKLAQVKITSEVTEEMLITAIQEAGYQVLEIH